MVTVHVVKVGNANGSLTFSPNDMTAKAGEMVQFQFAPNNHTVTQSTFDQPCQPISKNSNVTGIFSGFMPVSASSTTTPTYTIMINNTNPLWLYCSQGKHCQNGMSMVINAYV
jgi:plastocyanin